MIYTNDFLNCTMFHSHQLESPVYIHTHKNGYNIVTKIWGSIARVAHTLPGPKHRSPGMRKQLTDSTAEADRLASGCPWRGGGGDWEKVVCGSRTGVKALGCCVAGTTRKKAVSAGFLGLDRQDQPEWHNFLLHANRKVWKHRMIME